MDLESLKKLKGALLKKALSEKADEKSGLNSIIYPATDHGPNMPATMKTPASIPNSNDEEDEESIGEPDKGEPEKDGPGTSKTTSASLRVIPGESAMVPPQHKHTMLGGCVSEEKHRTSPFVQRCVAAITGGQPTSREDLSSSFAKCVSTEQKSGKDLSKNALRREGYPAAKEKFVQAIDKFKKNKTGDA